MFSKQIIFSKNQNTHKWLAKMKLNELYIYLYEHNK